MAWKSPGFWRFKLNFSGHRKRALYNQKIGTSRKNRDEWDPYLWADEDIFHCCHPFTTFIQTTHYDSTATLSPSYTNHFFKLKPQPPASLSYIVILLRGCIVQCSKEGFVWRPIGERKRTKTVIGLGPTSPLHTTGAALSYTHFFMDYLAMLSMSDVTRR